jgi:outer membrane protein OmpA-like peptidoglycan-associated protein
LPVKIEKYNLIVSEVALRRLVRCLIYNLLHEGRGPFRMSSESSMTSIQTNDTQLYSPALMNAQAKSDQAEKTTPVNFEQNTVKLSDEAKNLLSALKEIDKETKRPEVKNETFTDKVESFAHGALGLDHPDKVKEEVDSSYSVGQYLSAAVSVGGLLLAVI